MALPIAVPIVGGVLLLAGVGLRARQMLRDRARGTGGKLPPSPRAGTAAFDQPIFVPAVQIPPDSAPLAQREAAVAQLQQAAAAKPGNATAIAQAAQAAGVSVEDLTAAAKFMNIEPGVFVAMGVTPRDIQDAVFQMKQAQGTITGEIGIEFNHYKPGRKSLIGG